MMAQLQFVAMHAPSADFMIFELTPAVSSTGMDEIKENEDDPNVDKISENIVEEDSGPKPGFARRRVTRSVEK